MDKKYKALKKVLSTVKMHSTEKKNDMSPMKMIDSWTPSITLATKDAPFLSGAKVGDLKKIIIEAKVVSHNASIDGERKRDDYRLDILKAGCAGDAEDEEDDNDEDD